MFMGLRPEGLDHLGDEGDEAGGGARKGAGAGAAGGRRWQGWKAKK
jgi:hypothetical protein